MRFYGGRNLAKAERAHPEENMRLQSRGRLTGIFSAIANRDGINIVTGSLKH
jgi:hypothetical protein